MAKQPLSLFRKTCPKCGYGIMSSRKACCGERRRGVRAHLKCLKCGYKETITAADRTAKRRRRR